MGFGVAGVAGVGTGGYAFAEAFGSHVTRYRLTPPGWPQDLPLRLLVLSDLHACDPWMTAERISGMVEGVNALQPDCVLLLGDYVGQFLLPGRYPVGVVTGALGAPYLIFLLIRSNRNRGL